MADGTATLNDKLTVQVGILNNLKYARDSAAYDPTVSKEELADLDKAIAAQQKVVDELKNRITTEETAADTAKQAAATTASTQAAAAARQAKITEERTKIVTAYSAALENIARQEKIGLITAEQAGEARVAALDAQVVGLTNLIDALGLTTGATVDLRNAEELRLVTIKSQLEISKAAAI
jgi:hypothetical protein